MHLPHAKTLKHLRRWPSACSRSRAAVRSPEIIQFATWEGCGGHQLNFLDSIRQPETTSNPSIFQEHGDVGPAVLHVGVQVTITSLVA
jgi:hypothetical protein